MKRALVIVVLLITATACIAQTAPTIEWARCYGGSDDDEASSIAQTADGGFIVAGYTYSNDGDVSGNHGYWDYWVVKLNPSGDIVWQKSLGGSSHDYVHSITQTTDGGFIVAGESRSNDGDVSGNHGYSDYWIVKLNSLGEIQWQKCLGGSDWDVATSIVQTADCGFIVAGYSYSNDGDVSGNHGGYDYWVVKLNSSGESQWQKSLGGSSIDFAYSIAQTADGGFIVAGRSCSNDGDVTGWHEGYDVDHRPISDYWVLKLNSSGDIIWQKSLGGSSYDWAWSIAQTTDGGFIVAGYSYSNDGDVSGHHGMIGSADYWVVKLNSSGDIVWQKCLGGSNYDIARSIAQTSDGGFIVAGESASNDGDVSGNHGGYDYWVVKLSPPDPIGIAENPLPEQFSINIAPNPFNSAVSITIDCRGLINQTPTIEIFDMTGRMVYGNSVGEGLVPSRTTGDHKGLPYETIWQPDASIGSGIYFVRATVGDESVTKRIVYLK